MYISSNVTHLLIAKSMAVANPGITVGDGSELAADGQVAVINENNVTLDASTSGQNIITTPVIRFVQRSGSTVLFSPYITKANITKAYTVGYVAPVMPIHYLGYTGVTGSFDVISNNIYTLRILLKSNFKQFGNKQMLKFGVYKSDSSPTQASIVSGLASNLVANFAKETLINLRIDAISSCPLANDYAMDYNTATNGVVKGSTTLTMATGCLYNSGTQLAVGDWIRLSRTTTGTAVALVDPVYRVTKINSTTSFDVDRPFTMATGTYTTTSMSAIPAALVGDMGIKFTGVAMTFKLGFTEYEVPKFDLLPSCGNTAVTIGTAAVEPKGYGAQIQQMQYLLQGNMGNKYKMGFPPPTYYNDALETTGYNQIVISYFDNVADNAGATVTAKKDLIIAYPTAATYYNTGLIDLLQADTSCPILAAIADVS